MESVGACVLANDNPFTGQAADIFNRRINGESWAKIAKDYDLGSPAAARKLFTQLTGLTDYKAKGPALVQLAKGGVPTPPKVIKAKKLGDPKPAPDMEKLIIGDAPPIPDAHVNDLKAVQHFNSEGLGYQAISAKTGIPIAKIDEILHYHFMAKHKKNVWEVFKEKPQSQAGLNALKGKIFDARKMGLEVDEIVKHMGIDKDVVEGILKGTYKPPAPGAGNVFKPKAKPPDPPKMSQPKSPPKDTNWPGDPDPGDVLEPDFSAYPKATVDGLNKTHHPNKLPQSAQAAVRTYTGSTYTEINGALRGAREPTERVKKLISGMDKAMTPTTANMALTRGMTRKGFGMGQIPDEAIDALVGKVISDPGFLSTSVRPVFSQEIRLNLEVPAGAKGVWAKPISMHETEDEYILARGTKIMITGVKANKKQYGTTWTVIGRVVV
jgi:hypothetical protein